MQPLRIFAGAGGALVTIGIGYRAMVEMLAGVMVMAGCRVGVRVDKCQRKSR